MNGSDEVGLVGRGATQEVAEVVPQCKVESVAVLSDIHANVAALRAVIGELATEPVEAVVLLGDITWGTFPRQTVELIEELAHLVRTIIWIKGNGDRAVVELTDGKRPATSPRDSWMIAAHRPKDVAMLRASRFQVDVTIAELGVLRMCHGSPRADIEAITPRTPLTRLAEVTRNVEAWALVTGHTHLQFSRPLRDSEAIRFSVNPGSVGLPYGVTTPGARWLRVHSEDPTPMRFLTTPYDLDQYISDIAATDDPGKDRIISLLRHPPSTDEVISFAEEKVFVD